MQRYGWLLGRSRLLGCLGDLRLAAMAVELFFGLLAGGIARLIEGALDWFCISNLAGESFGQAAEAPNDELGGTFEYPAVAIWTPMELRLSCCGETVLLR